MDEWSPEVIAHHEAGHAVAHSIFGFHNSGLSTLGEPERGCAGWSESLQYWENGEDLENYLISICAGYAAQCRFDPASKEDAWIAAGHDLEIARRILKSLGVEFIAAEWISKAEAFVEANWSAIVAVAKEALVYQELDGEEIDFIIGAARAADAAEAEEFREGLDRYRTLMKPTRKPPDAS
jgi:hypothetical protein